MRGFSIIALALMFSLLSAFPAAGLAQTGAQSFEIGQHYENVAQPGTLAEKDDGRVEVISFFWYNCGSCYSVDPAVSEWAAQLPADVRFLRMPAAFNPAVNFHARIFMTLRALGLSHEADMTVFDIFRNQRKAINTHEQLPTVAKALNIDPDKFIKTFDSKEVADMMNNLDRVSLAYDLPGVPAMVIDGQYRFDIGTTDGPEGFFKLADILIGQQRELRKKEGRGPK